MEAPVPQLLYNMCILCRAYTKAQIPRRNFLLEIFFVGGRFRTAPNITLFIPGTPLKTTHLQKDV